jgi:hypothetical protein
VIYLEASVVLAHLLAETQQPPADLWTEPLVTSRLLEYELWNRLHALGRSASHAEELRAVLAKVEFLEMSGAVLLRALQPFPGRVRTLDALHLASMHYLHARGRHVMLASYDTRTVEAARALKLDIYPL